jgi:hypothetical protein
MSGYRSTIFLYHLEREIIKKKKIKHSSTVVPTVDKMQNTFGLKIKERNEDFFFFFF